MSIDNTQTNKYVTPTTDEQTPENQHIPCVQIGFPGDDGSKRAPRLQPLSDPIPDHATTASPVYMLTQKQYERQANLNDPYRIKGEYLSIATELQDECEADNRVVYPVHIESDVFPVEEPETLIGWFHEFVEEYLEIPFNTCSLYYSGHRSIHVHVPRFVTTESELKQLKDLAESFCDDTGGKLDCGIYSRKRMFRLPGVTHSKTGLKKVAIKPEWGRERIIRESTAEVPAVKTSYEMILRNVFKPQPSMGVNETLSASKRPRDILQILTDESFVLESKKLGSEVELLTIEDDEYPDESADRIRWLQYNAKEFSPYALATKGSRSVAVVRVEGTPFGHVDRTIGKRSDRIHALIPCYFYGARGCAGGEFTKNQEHAPLQLSKRDYEKWDFDVGDNVVVIGGQSRQSKLIPVDPWRARVVGHALTGENASRESALEYLVEEEFDVGKAGNSGKTSSVTRRKNEPCSSNSRNSETKAARKQRVAEEDGIQVLGRTEISNVANRLLKIGGWDHAWNWIETQYGDQFRPEKTTEQMREIVEEYPDLDVTIPSERSR